VKKKSFNPLRMVDELLRSSKQEEANSHNVVGTIDPM
jgi:hypothetical protein